VSFKTYFYLFSSYLGVLPTNIASSYQCIFCSFTWIWSISVKMLDQENIG
jgi:hypothetical protein